MDPYILNLETATDVCSVCISRGEQILSLHEITGNQHAAQITVLISDCLKQSGLTVNDLEAVAVSDGPGSYTSLRVGAAAAKGICYGAGIPMIAVDTLTALAYAAMLRAEDSAAPADLLCPMIDARRMEVYTALFEAPATGAGGSTPEGLRPLAPLRALIVEAHAFDEYFDRGRSIIFCGPGAGKCREVLTAPFARFDPIQCSASFLVPFSVDAYRRKRFADVAYHTPLYFKEPHITAPRS